MSSLLVSILLNVVSIKAETVNASMTKVTLVVEGMMKSKGGVTWLSWPESVSAALLELAGVSKVDVHLESDEFTVLFDAYKVSIEELKSAVSRLGYAPRVARSRVLHSSPDTISGRENVEGTKGRVPEIIAAALREAEGSKQLVFVYFYAEWCGACKILDRTTLKDPGLLVILDYFVFLKVDADIDPDALTYFSVLGLPTLMVLNEEGVELYRHVGPITAAKLGQELDSLWHWADIQAGILELEQAKQHYPAI